MEKQEMEVEWKLETKNGNGNWKRKWKLETEMEMHQSLACSIAHAQGRYCATYNYTKCFQRTLQTKIHLHMFLMHT